MKITLLGSGDSRGVPVIGCKCDTCTTQHPKNIRLRTSALVEHKNTKILIDTGPDFRAQALKHNLSDIDGILYTHPHHDHINGISDVLPLVYNRATKIDAMPIFASKDTLTTLRNLNSYVIRDTNMKTGFIECHEVEYYTEVTFKDITFQFFPQKHGRITSTGIILNNIAAYSTDTNQIHDQAASLLTSNKVWFIECHGTDNYTAHINVEQMLAYVKRRTPHCAITLHMGHTIDYFKIQDVFKTHGVIAGYDGLLWEEPDYSLKKGMTPTDSCII